MSDKRIHRKCAAKACCNNDCNKNITFFRFPQDKDRAILWAKAVDRYDLIVNAEKLYNSHRLCIDHFEEKYFLNDLRNRLMPNAVPSISLTKSSTAHIEEIEENEIGINKYLYTSNADYIKMV
ncbi:hypothetical protein PUN28_017776 [Cardiocondyla obscurior]|uniref:THAP-type domain-containing protein n=1 Tax=Cardiocondyla obscurior TaxID=286306 RepID=A0AAW2EMY2_9HYME